MRSTFCLLLAAFVQLHTQALGAILMGTNLLPLKVEAEKFIPDENSFDPEQNVLKLEKNWNHFRRKYHHHRHYQREPLDVNLDDDIISDVAKNNDRPDPCRSSDSDSNQPIFHKYRQHNHRLHNRAKKRRRSLADRPYLLPHDEFVNVGKRTRSTKQLMLTKPYWPWP